jgi:AraC-like DNA-binding protein
LKAQSDIPVHHLLQTDFLVSDTGNINLGEFEINHRVDFFAIIWYLEDAGLHYIDFEPYPVKENTIYLLARGQVHALPGTPPKSRVILLSKSFFDGIADDDLRFLFGPFNNNGIDINDEAAETLAYLFQLMKIEGNMHNDARLQHFYIDAFLFQLLRLSRDSKSVLAYQDERMRRLIELIGQNHKTEKFAGFYADKIGVTAKRLNQIVKEKFELSVSQLIYNYTLIEARREISHGSKSLKEIAIDLGFKGQSYFSRFFKKQTGYSPERFRQENS